MEKIIQSIESLRDCVCDGYNVEGDELHVDLRTVRHDLEYACRVTIDMRTGFIDGYEFLWSWHRNAQQTSVVEAPKKLVVPTSSTMRRTVRRTVNESVYA